MSLLAGILASRALVRWRHALCMLAGTLLLALTGAHEASADNTGCAVNGTVADCPEVPSDGVRYESGVKTINITGNAGSPTSVESSVEGIYLTESGGSGSSSTTASFDLSKKVQLDLVPDEDNTPDTWVLADIADQPILSGGHYIIVTGERHILHQRHRLRLR